MYCEKATKFETTNIVGNAKTKQNIFSNFVGFFEYTNFTELCLWPVYEAFMKQTTSLGMSNQET